MLRTVVEAGPRVGVDERSFCSGVREAGFHWSGDLEPGLHRGWPETGATGLHWSGDLEPGLHRGWPETDATRLHWSGDLEPGLHRGWPETDATRLRKAVSIAVRFASPAW